MFMWATIVPFESIEPSSRRAFNCDHRTIIEGYGMMHVKLTKANGSTKILRAHAAYIPGFIQTYLHQFTEERIDVCFDQRIWRASEGQKREASQS